MSKARLPWTIDDNNVPEDVTVVGDVDAFIEHIETKSEMLMWEAAERRAKKMLEKEWFPNMH